MKKNLNITNEELMKLDYKHTHILKKFTNDNGAFALLDITSGSNNCLDCNFAIARGN